MNRNWVFGVAGAAAALVGGTIIAVVAGGAGQGVVVGNLTQGQMQQMNAHNGVVNVIDYAKCDWNGTSGTDDTVALNTGIAAGGVGATILWGANKCYSDGGLAVPPDGQRWIGYLTNQSINDNNHSNLVAYVTGSQRAVDLTNAAGVTLDGFSVTDPNPGAIPNNTVGIYLSPGTNRPRLLDVNVKDFGLDIANAGASYAEFIGCSVVGARQTGLDIYGQSTDTTVLGGLYSNSNYYANIRVEGADNTFIGGGVLIDEGAGGTWSLSIEGATNTTVDGFKIYASSSGGNDSSGIRIGQAGTSPDGVFINNGLIQPYSSASDYAIHISSGTNVYVDRVQLICGTSISGSCKPPLQAYIQDDTGKAHFRVSLEADAGVVEDISWNGFDTSLQQISGNLPTCSGTAITPDAGIARLGEVFLLDAGAGSGVKQCSCSFSSGAKWCRDGIFGQTATCSGGTATACP